MTTTQCDRDTFVRNLRKSGLIPESQLDRVLEAFAKITQAVPLARALVEQKHLTRFQAEMLLAGRTTGFVMGQYRIVDQLGRGGMGRVFKAVHQSMKRVVAIKVVSVKQIKSGKGQQLFEREVRAAAKLMHPNIVNAFDANHLGDRHYLVMEFVDGPNLEHLVREQGALPIGQACEFVRQAAVGLQYAFEHGMVHRDIKPANLLVQKVDDKPDQCLVKILDFGLARLHEPEAEGGGTIVTSQNTLMGTPDYVSPEQSRDVHDVDIRSDLYSLGCTLYYLLAGQVPFPEGTPLEKLMRHATTEATPVEAIRPEIPVELGAIVRSLMAKERADRFQTPAELIAALQPYCTTSTASWKSAALAIPAPGSESDLLGESGSHSEEDILMLDTLATEDTPQSFISIVSKSRLDMREAPRRVLVVCVLLVLFAVLAIAYLGYHFAWW